MELILKEDVQNVGFKDEIVIVKNGYGRNFLIPKGKAIIATESARKVLAENLTEDKTKTFGRTNYMTSVIFDGKKSDIGKIVQVKISKSNRSTLFGEIANNSNQKVA